MVTSTNHVTAGPNLHSARPPALWRFRNIFLPNIGEDQKKSYDFSSGLLAGTASYYGKYTSLINALRSQKG